MTAIIRRSGLGTAVLLSAWFLLVALPSAATLLDRDIFGPALSWLAGASGAAALAMLLLQFLSSGRFGWLTDAPGIDRTMRFHQLAGRGAAVLALAHAVLAIGSAAPPTLAGWAGAAAMVLPSSFFATGTAALAVLAILVALGVLRTRLPWPYEVWRAGHLVGALAVAALATQHALAVGVTSSRPPMVVFWGLLAAAACASAVWVHALKPWRMKRRPYRVVRNVEAAQGIREIVLEPAGGAPLRYRAGQFAWVLIGQPAVPLLDHPFSIASSPRAGTGVRFLVKARGDFTGALAEVPAGARAWIDGPFGNFTLDGREGDTIALFAGGIGIAPVLGLLEELRLAGDRRPISLVYGVARASQLAGLGPLAGMRGDLDLQARIFAEQGAGAAAADWSIEAGRPSEASVAEALRGDARRALCFVCGPPAMLTAIRRQLAALGVPRGQVVYERFEYD